MANYDVMIKSYEHILVEKAENCDVEAITLSLNAFKTLNNKSAEEIFALFNTGAFNDILKGYCKKAMENRKMDKEQINAVMDELKWLLDTCNAKQML